MSNCSHCKNSIHHYPFITIRTIDCSFIETHLRPIINSINPRYFCNTSCLHSYVTEKYNPQPSQASLSTEGV